LSDKHADHPAGKPLMTHMARSAVLRTTVVLGLSAIVTAQEAPTPPAQDPSIPKLELASDPMIEKGQVAAVKGTVSADGVRYTVGSLSILQPVSVMLFAGNESDDITLSVFKTGWTEPRRTGSTRGTGKVQFVFRTQGGLNLLIRGAAQPTPFALIVWAGDELHPPMSDVVVSYDDFRKSHPAEAGKLKEGGVGGAGLSSTLWMVLAAIGGAAIVLVLLRIINRRKQA
jgi:hypothetical protein